MKPEDYTLLKYRIESFFKISRGSICDDHKRYYLDNYEKRKTICCDPFKTHQKPIRDSRMYTIDVNLCKDALNLLAMRLEPGEKVCKNCQKKVKDYVDEEKAEINAETVRIML